VDIIRRTLFASDTLDIGLFAARPVSDACGEVERQGSHVVVLPVSGVFSRHDAPGRHVTGTPSHAVLVAADTPYRISFPGAIGDRALTLRFDHAVAHDRLDCHDGRDTASHGLLPAGGMMLRNLLWTRLERAEADAFEAEALGLDLLDVALASMRTGDVPIRRSAQVRWMRALARVKEAVAVAPAESWSVARLADIANLSPFHLSRLPSDGRHVHLRLCRAGAPRAFARARSRRRRRPHGDRARRRVCQPQPLHRAFPQVLWLHSDGAPACRDGRASR
jgi:hypothetical protein